MNATAILAGVEFAPLLPWPWLGALAAAVLATLGFARWRRVDGLWWRAAAAAALLLALADPRLTEQRREKLADVVLVVVDESPSQKLGDRPAQTEAALAELRRRLARIPNLEIRIRREPGGPDGTNLFSAARTALADLPRRRLAGVVLITDGRVHDHPQDLDAIPIHALLTGRPDEHDRRVAITRGPGFALVGRHARIELRVEDSRAEAAGNVPLTVRLDGEDFLQASVPLNRQAVIEVPIRHAGSVIVEVESPAPPGDLLPANNRAAIAVPAVRDRMKVLLISGEPHSGERVWRNLLKSDPAVDLIHFTILRPPEKDDRTPIRELALITFPVRELFEEKLSDFDLVVFDRYRHRGIMAAPYYQLLADYVKKGGAVLAAIGPEFAQADGIVDTALGDILPLAPDGGVIEAPFVPTLTDTGRRHPVTSGLSAPAAWGPWLRQISARPGRGQTLLTGAQGKPLLVLDQVEQGRVALVMSDTIWLWARGYQGGGPHDELLRRLAHWLMREPDLEAESLAAEMRGAQMRITRRSLSPRPGQAVVTAPDGTRSPLDLVDQGDGRWLADLPAEQPGLWRVEAERMVALAARGSVDSPELAEVTATAELLAPTAQASGGQIRFLGQDGVPDIRQVTTVTADSRWLELLRRDDYLVRGILQMSLIPLELLMVVVSAALFFAWRRDGR